MKASHVGEAVVRVRDTWAAAARRLVAAARNAGAEFILPEADALADAYLGHGIIGPGSRSDALHVALATIGRVDVLVRWNVRHIVNLGKIRLFNAVNLEQGYGLIEIRTLREVLADEDVL